MTTDKEARELLSDSDTSLQKTSGDTADGALVEHVPTALGDRNALPKLHRRLLWKIDLQLMPLAFIIYWLAFLDRTNIGVARLSGLQESLRMTGEDFMTAVALLYPLFIVCELPSNWVMRKATPRIFISILLVAFGLISALQGAVTTKEGLYAVRIFLGAFEAGIMPGIIIWLSNFYRRREFMLRLSLYFAGATFAGAFSGLLAAALSKMAGLAGRPGWAWVFLIEGIFTIFVGLLLIFVIPSNPDDLWWLTKEERQLAWSRLQEDNLDDNKADRLTRRDVVAALTDLRNIFMAIGGFAAACPIYGLAIFGPSIVAAAFPNISSTRAQLLSCPPYAVAFVFSIFIAFVSDRLQWRWLSGIISTSIALIGFAMCYGLPLSHSSARYGGLFFAAAGTFTLPPSMQAWMTTFHYNPYKRATGVGVCILGVSCGALAATFFFPDGQKSNGFKGGLLANLIMDVVIIVCLTAIELLVVRDNRRKNAGVYDHLLEELERQGLTDLEIRRRLGDRHPQFRSAL